MGGKEREREPPPATDDEDATQATTQEGCWRRGGVIRQSQPTAQHHQITAGLASSAKRRAAAMSQGSGRRNEWPTSSDAAVSSVRARNHSQHRSPLTLRWQRSRRRQLSAWRRLRISATGCSTHSKLDSRSTVNASPSGAPPKRTSAPGSSTWTVACARVRARAPTTV